MLKGQTADAASCDNYGRRWYLWMEASSRCRLGSEAGGLWASTSAMVTPALASSSRPAQCQ